MDFLKRRFDRKKTQGKEPPRMPETSRRAARKLVAGGRWHSKAKEGYKSGVAAAKSRANVIGVVLPSRCGKTTFAEGLGMIDSDALIPTNRMRLHSDNFPSEFASGGWAAAMHQYCLDASRTLDRMVFSGPTILLGHSVTTLTAMGVVPAVRLKPTKRFQDANCRGASDMTVAFARANYAAVDDEEDLSPIILIDTVEDAIEAIRRIAGDSVPDNRPLRLHSDPDTVVDLYREGKISRVQADFAIRGLCGSFCGLGPSANDWAKALAGRTSGRRGRQYGRMTPGVSETANLIDPDYTATLLRVHEQASPAFKSALLMFWISVRDQFRLRAMVEPILLVERAEFGSVARGVARLARKSDYYLGEYITNEERGVLSELWLLDQDSPSLVDLNLEDRLAGKGRSHKKDIDMADIWGACKAAGATEGGLTVMQAAAAELGEWAKANKVDGFDIRKIAGAEQAFAGRTTPWESLMYRVVRMRWPAVGVQIAGMMAPKACEVATTNWRDRFEAATSRLMAYLLACGQVGIRVELTDDIKLVGQVAVALSDALASLGLPPSLLLGLGSASTRADIVANIVHSLCGQVALCVEMAYGVGVVGGRPLELLMSNWWQRIKRSGCGALGEVLHLEFERWYERSSSDRRLERLVAYCCTSKKSGGLGSFTITGGRFDVSRGWSGTWITCSDIKIKKSKHRMKPGSLELIAGATSTSRVNGFGQIGAHSNAEIGVLGLTGLAYLSCTSDPGKPVVQMVSSIMSRRLASEEPKTTPVEEYENDGDLAELFEYMGLD